MKPDRLQHIVNMLNRLKEQERERWLIAIQQQDAEMAARLRERLLCFGNLAQLATKDWQRLKKDIPETVLHMALRGADNRVLEACLSSLSQRAANHLLEEIEQLGPQPASKVDTARKVLLDWVARQESNGQLSLGKGEGWIE